MQVNFAPLGSPFPGSVSDLVAQSNQPDASVPEQVASQFEGLFVSMLLKELRQTLQEGLFQGEQSDSYGALFDQYLGEHLADRESLGIRQLILSQYRANQPGEP